jgi:hypothetical protein
MARQLAAQFVGGPMNGRHVTIEAESIRWEVRVASMDGEPVVAADGPAVLDADAAVIWTPYFLRRFAGDAVVFATEPAPV